MPRMKRENRYGSRPVAPPDPCAAMTPEGPVIVSSVFGPGETMDRLITAVTDRGMAVFTRIDHAGAAADVGMVLRWTEVPIFGNPRGGTHLMQAAPSIAIDLPLKALVWQADDGSTRLSYADPNWLATRHGIDPAVGVIVAAMAGALASVATHATTRKGDRQQHDRAAEG